MDRLIILAMAIVMAGALRTPAELTAPING